MWHWLGLDASPSPLRSQAPRFHPPQLYLQLRKHRLLPLPCSPLTRRSLTLFNLATTAAALPSLSISSLKISSWRIRSTQIAIYSKTRSWLFRNQPLHQRRSLPPPWARLKPPLPPARRKTTSSRKAIP